MEWLWWWRLLFFGPGWSRWPGWFAFALWPWSTGAAGSWSSLVWGTTKAAFGWLAGTLTQCRREAITAAHAIAAGTAIILTITAFAIVARGAPALTIAAGSAPTFAISTGTAPAFAVAARATIILAVAARATIVFSIATGAALLLVVTALAGAAKSPLLPTRGIA